MPTNAKREGGVWKCCGCARLTTERDELRGEVEWLEGELAEASRAVSTEMEDCVELQRELKAAEQRAEEWKKMAGLATKCAEQAKRQRDDLGEALGLDTPWPLDSVLERLIYAAEHLLDSHSCDCHGYERIQHALEAAGKIRTALGRGGKP